MTKKVTEKQKRIVLTMTHQCAGFHWITCILFLISQNIAAQVCPFHAILLFRCVAGRRIDGRDKLQFVTNTSYFFCFFFFTSPRTVFMKSPEYNHAFGRPKTRSLFTGISCFRGRNVLPRLIASGIWKLFFANFPLPSGELMVLRYGANHSHSFQNPSLPG